MSATNGEPAMPLEGDASQPNCIRVHTARSEDIPRIVTLLLASFYPHLNTDHWFYWLIRIGIREDIRTRLKTNSERYACLVAVSLDSWTYPSKNLEQTKTQARQTGSVVSTSIADVPIARTSTAGTSIIGTIEISQRPCETWRFFPPQRAYLSNLAIDSAHRRQGAAKQLLQVCESVALQWGFHCIYLHVMANNKAAQALYQQAGYEPCEVSNPIMASLGIRPERLLLVKRLSKEDTAQH